MATPKYDALQEKVIQWSNRDREIFGVTAANPTAWKEYVGDFLSYAADEAYRLLRIPPLEFDRTYTIETTDIVGSANISVLGTNNYAGTGGVAYNKILLPVDFVEMSYLRFAGLAGTSVNGQLLNSGIVFNERTDERTFFDIYAETYSNYYWMRSGDYLFIKPALPAGSQIAFHYYRQLPALDADYSVVASNVLFTPNTNAPATLSAYQPFLTQAGSPTPFILVQNTSPSYTVTTTTVVPASSLPIGQDVYSSDIEYETIGKIVSVVVGATSTTITLDRQAVVAIAGRQYAVGLAGAGNLWFVVSAAFAPFATYAAYDSQDAAELGRAALQLQYPTFSFFVESLPRWFTGNEVGNWLKDQNERILIWGALMNAGSFLDDEKIEARYAAKFNGDIDSLNREERMRRAKGGNVQVNFNGRGLI